jgi:hypothetical protein
MDVKAHHGTAIAVIRQAVELARTAISATAVGKFMRPDGPIGHGVPPDFSKSR